MRRRRVSKGAQSWSRSAGAALLCLGTLALLSLLSGGSTEKVVQPAIVTEPLSDSQGRGYGSGLYHKGSTPHIWVPFSVHYDATRIHNVEFPAKLECQWPDKEVTHTGLVQSYSSSAVCGQPKAKHRCVSVRVASCSTCPSYQLCEPYVVRREAPQKASLSLCTIFRTESEYLDEWIAYHHLMGVEHFYMYDDISTDSRELARVLNPYIHRGIVTYIFWPDADDGRGWQLAALNDALHRFGHETEYMAHIDVDEFFVIPQKWQKDTSSLHGPVVGVLPEVTRKLFKALQNPKSAGSLFQIHVPWSIFGHSGHSERPDGLVTSSFTRRAVEVQEPQPKKAYEYRRQYDDRTVTASKLICKTALFGFVQQSPHFVQPNNTVHYSKPAGLANLRLNHYHVKSESDWRKRYEKMNKEVLLEGAFDAMMSQYDQVTDPYLLQYEPLIHEHIEQLRLIESA